MLVSSRTIRHLLLATAVLCAAASAAPQLAPTLYFPSAAAEAAQRAELHAILPAVVQALADPRLDVPKALARTDGLLIALQDHAAYFKVKTLEDTGDQAAKAGRDAVAADMARLEAAVNARLSTLTAAQAASLGPYAYLAETAHRDAAHAPAPTASGPALHGLADDYHRLVDTIERPAGGASLDTTTRRAALAAWSGAYDHAAPAAATLLAAIVSLENRDAAAAGYRNAADRKYQQLGLNDAMVSQMLAAVTAQAPAYRDYQEVLARHAAQTLGVDPVLSVEVDLAAAHEAPRSLDDARALIAAALQPLGPDYSRRFAALLDPANGRLDLDGGAHRARAATSIAAYRAPTALYYNGYDGSLRDVSKLAHEGGHAIHRELMNAAGIPVYARAGPNYLFEAFAIFNELLLLDHAVQTATTPAGKQAALERLLSKIALELFVSAEETGFERALYTGGALDASTITARYQAAIAPFAYWPMGDAGTARGWMRKALLFEDPLYLVNYLYASVIAVALFDKQHTDPAFAAHYQALLRSGFQTTPQAMLATLGIRLDDPGLVHPVAAMLTARTAQLDALYAQTGPHARGSLIP